MPVFCDDENFSGDSEAREFVALYLDLLSRMKETERPSLVLSSARWAAILLS